MNINRGDSNGDAIDNILKADGNEYKTVKEAEADKEKWAARYNKEWEYDF